MNPGLISLIGGPALVIGMGLAATMLLRWRWGFYGLLMFLPFAGPVSLTFFGNPYFKLAKDILFVIPLLALIVVFHLRDLRGVRVPAPVGVSLAVLAVVVLVQTANPGVPNLAVAIVGAKVWLLYLPLVVVAGAALRNDADFTRLMRLLAVLPLLPVVFGFVQYMQSISGGYRPTMVSYYGPAALTVTQRFSDFDFGGVQLFRIPSTFTFHVQYFGFLLASLVPAYAVARGDPSRRWRRAGWAMLGLLVAASLLSGARSAFLLVPVFIVLMLALEGRGGLLLILAPVGAVLLGVAATGAGMDLGGLGRAITGRFLSREGTFEPIIGDLLFGLLNYPLGNGVGLNTDAARFVSNGGRGVILESYYGKTVNELGHVGLLAVVFVFSAILFCGLRTLRRLTTTPFRAFAMGCIAFTLLLIVNNAKLRALDFDPTNVLFWVYVGVLFRLPALERQAVAAGWTPVARRFVQPTAPVQPVRHPA